MRCGNDKSILDLSSKVINRPLVIPGKCTEKNNIKMDHNIKSCERFGLDSFRSDEGLLPDPYGIF